MKARSDFQQAGNTTVQLNASGARFGDARKDLQQRRFTRSIAADDREYFSGSYLKTDIIQGYQSFRRAT
jgi:hypothetical protein